MKKIITIILALLFGVLVGFIGIFYYSINHKSQGEEKDFIVKQGQSTNQIAENLKKDDLIISARIFSIYAKLKGDLIQEGVYNLSREQNMKEILAKISSGKADENLITIPEGYRLTQIDELLAKKGVIKAGELIKVASAEEGYLFPDTYRFLPNTPAADVRQEMIDNFNKRTAGLGLTRDQLILASIVEREAKFDEDRAKIAGVYLNRLDQGMRLEADPTIQYAKGSWEPIKISDYRSVDSSYNTYLHNGLPPGPICNPGLASIEAVLRPERDGWLYFFHKSDGHAVYSSTLQEHEENLKKYR